MRCTPALMVPFGPVQQATSHRPMIAEERARLAIANGAAPREQLQPLVALYTEVGAVGHVRRLEAELGA